MKAEIFVLIFRLILIVLVSVLIPAARTWLNIKTDSEKMNRIKDWANTAVWAAEQLHNKVEHNDPDGTLRRKYAYEAINQMALKLGVVLTSSEIDALIECAVHELNLFRTPDTL